VGGCCGDELLRDFTRNLLTYEASAGVKHHVALSVVGTYRLSESGYFRAKIAQEKLIKSGTIPYSIVHATHVFEFLKQLADISFDGKKVRLPDALFQPMAADDVASAVRQDRCRPAHQRHCRNWGARNRFASMNSYGSDWHRSMIFARSSQTRTLFTPAQESASAHSFRTTVRNSAKFVLQTGSRTRHLRSRRQTCSPQRLRRNEAEISGR